MNMQSFDYIERNPLRRSRFARFRAAYWEAWGATWQWINGE